MKLLTHVRKPFTSFGITREAQQEQYRNIYYERGYIGPIFLQWPEGRTYIYLGYV